jgi:hypothetical protein
MQAKECAARHATGSPARPLRPGERYEPMLGRVFYSAAWLNAGDAENTPYEVSFRVRRLDSHSGVVADGG